MGAEIKDEFSVMPISRQRKYYLRQRKRGRCTKCGKPLDEGSLCLEHLIQMREYRREKFGLKRRYTNSLSYKAEAKAEAEAEALLTSGKRFASPNANAALVCEICG